MSAIEAVADRSSFFRRVLLVRVRRNFLSPVFSVVCIFAIGSHEIGKTLIDR